MAVVMYPSSLMIKVRALYARAPSLGVFGAVTQAKHCVCDKDPSIQHWNYAHQCYYKSEPFHDCF